MRYRATPPPCKEERPRPRLQPGRHGDAPGAVVFRRAGCLPGQGGLYARLAREAVNRRLPAAACGPTTLTSVTLTGFTGTGTLRFDVIGTSLRLYTVNNAGVATLVTSATDSSLSSGTVGLRGRRGAEFSAYSAAVATPPQTAMLPFTDNFATTPDGLLSNYWAPNLGNFNIQTIGANNYAVATTAGASTATLNNVNKGDVSVQATVTALASGQWAGLVARYQSASNYYQGIVRNTGGVYTAEVYRILNGTATLLTKVTLSGFSGTGTVLFNITGSTLTLSVNGARAPNSPPSAPCDGRGIMRRVRVLCHQLPCPGQEDVGGHRAPKSRRGLEREACRRLNKPSPDEEVVSNGEY
jgi:hypothetical protein